MRKLIFGAAVVLVMTSHAQADWLTTVEEDLFSEGNTAVMIGMISSNSSIYARCAGGEVELAYIEAAPDAAEIDEPVTVGDIVFKGDNGTRFSSETKVYRHNNDFVGFTFEDADAIPDVIRDFGTADSKIAVGLDLILSDEPMTVTASARGSSKAVKQFLEACEIAE